MITLLPLGIVIALCILFFFLPKQSNAVLSQIRFFFGDTFGTYYLVIGLGIFILSLYIAGSRYGNIVLGEPDEKPKYSFFAWGSMMFTCGLAADILFYSFSEWVLYATDPHIKEMGSIQDWAGVYPLFHWSFIPWGFYLVLAVAFGFMLHVRKRNRRYRNYIQRSHSTDGNHHRRALSYCSQQNRYQYYHSSDYMRRIYLFLTARIQGNQQISQYLHLYVLWSDRIRIIIRW